jgi:hypothetical protein
MEEIMGAPLDLVGQSFGDLTVVSKGPRQGTGMLWNCVCSCGNTAQIRSDKLRGGRQTSCGCMSQIGRPPRHGKHGTRIYKIWDAMKQRCNNVNHKSYADYGGRGITYDRRWELFDNFYADMGDPPSEDHSLDRRDNNGPYSKDNCRWATEVEQHNNRSDNVLLTLDGITRTQAEWSRATGLSRLTIQHRRKRGWSMRATLTLPTGARRPKDDTND